MSRTQTKCRPLTCCLDTQPLDLIKRLCCGCTGNVTCQVQSVSSVGNAHTHIRTCNTAWSCVSNVCVSYSENLFFHKLKMWHSAANSSYQPPLSEELHSDLLTFCHASCTQIIYLKYNIPAALYQK